MKKLIFIVVLVVILVAVVLLLLPEKKEETGRRTQATQPVKMVETATNFTTVQNQAEQVGESLRGSWELKKKKITTIITFGEESRVYIKAYRKDMPDTNAEGVYLVEGDQIKFLTYDGEVEYAFEIRGDSLVIEGERYARVDGDVHDE